MAISRACISDQWWGIYGYVTEVSGPLPLCKTGRGGYSTCVRWKTIQGTCSIFIILFQRDEPRANGMPQTKSEMTD